MLPPARTRRAPTRRPTRAPTQPALLRRRPRPRPRPRPRTTPQAASKPPKFNLTGVVVSADNQAQSYTSSIRKGQPYEVHPDGPTPKVGSTVTTGDAQAGQRHARGDQVPARQGGAEDERAAHGVVSYVNHAKNRYAGISAWRLVAGRGREYYRAAAARRRARAEAAARVARARRQRGNARQRGCSRQTRTDAGAAKPPLELAGVITSIDAVGHSLHDLGRRTEHQRRHDRDGGAGIDQVERIDRAGDSRRPRHYRR